MVLLSFFSFSLGGVACCPSRGAAPVASVTGPEHVVRPAPPPQTAAECSVCRGEWGRHGISQTESCNCRTNDGGKRCTDGDDCQGVCVAATDNPEQDVREPGPPARGFFVGRCSELKTVFGCIRIIDHGVRARGPVSLAEPPATMCVD